jgi:hypothetical protein
VRQPRRADEVADPVDAGFAGAQPFVDGDMAPFDGDTGVFKPDVFDIADNPDGKDDTVGYGTGRKVKGVKIRALVRLARLKNQPFVGAPAISQSGTSGVRAASVVSFYFKYPSCEPPQPT